MVGFGSPRPSFLKIEKGMRFMLAPKSHKTLSKLQSPIMQGIVKLPGSFNFYGNLF